MNMPDAIDSNETSAAGYSTQQTASFTTMPGGECPFFRAQRLKTNIDRELRNRIYEYLLLEEESPPHATLCLVPYNAEGRRDLTGLAPYETPVAALTQVNCLIRAESRPLCRQIRGQSAFPGWTCLAFLQTTL